MKAKALWAAWLLQLRSGCSPRLLLTLLTGLKGELEPTYFTGQSSDFQNVTPFQGSETTRLFKLLLVTSTVGTSLFKGFFKWIICIPRMQVWEGARRHHGQNQFEINEIQTLLKIQVACPVHWPSQQSWSYPFCVPLRGSLLRVMPWQGNLRQEKLTFGRKGLGSVEANGFLYVDSSSHVLT